MNRTAIIIPAYNAAHLLEPVVRASLAELPAVVVVDDGSTDGTGAVAAKAGAQVLWHTQNRGKGAALRTGFDWALQNDYDAVITLDADGQHLPSDVPKFLAARAESGADLIIGGRAHLFPRMLPRRRLANRFSASSISMVSGVTVTDSQSGYRLYTAKLLRSIKLHADGFDMESEVIVRAGRGGFRVVTIPIALGFVNGITTSHYKPVKDTLKIAWTVLKTRLRV